MVLPFSAAVTNRTRAPVIVAVQYDRDAKAALNKIAATLKEQATKPTGPEAQPCKAGTDLRTSDLCAQWKAADAAANSAYYSLWQLIVAAIGLLVGAGTLVAAFIAARYAKRAADEAKRSADAAVEASRCHIIIKGAVLSFGEKHGELLVRADIVNDGSTPARKVRLTCRARVMHYFRYGPGEDEFAAGPEQTRISPKTEWHNLDFGHLVPANSGRQFEEVVNNFWLTEEERSKDAYIRVCVQLIVSYIDVFGTRGRRLEVRTLEDLHPVDFNRNYGLEVNFAGGEGEEWE